MWSNLHNISVNHVLSWQQPVLQLWLRQDGAELKLAEMFLEQREDSWSIFFGHRPESLCVCNLGKNTKNIPICVLFSIFSSVLKPVTSFFCLQMAAHVYLREAVELECSLQVHVLSQTRVVDLHQLTGIQRAMPQSERICFFYSEGITKTSQEKKMQQISFHTLLQNGESKDKTKSFPSFLQCCIMLNLIVYRLCEAPAGAQRCWEYDVSCVDGLVEASQVDPSGEFSDQNRSHPLLPKLFVNTKEPDVNHLLLPVQHILRISFRMFCWNKQGAYASHSRLVNTNICRDSSDEAD